MKIFKRFWISRLREIIVEVVVARGDEEEADEEVDQEDTENGSKGNEKADDDEDHVIDKRLILVWTWDILRILVINIHA